MTPKLGHNKSTSRDSETAATSPIHSGSQVGTRRVLNYKQAYQYKFKIVTIYTPVSVLG